MEYSNSPPQRLPPLPRFPPNLGFGAIYISNVDDLISLVGVYSVVVKYTGNLGKESEEKDSTNKLEMERVDCK